MIEISHTSYHIRIVLESFDVTRSGPIPAFPSENPRAVKEEEKIVEGVPAREVVGSLTWIANQMRPDSANAVRAFARH